MKKTKIIIILLASALLAGTYTWAADQDQQQEQQRGYIGVRLDPNPLPPLVAKHLNLQEGEGILIYNIQVDSPADKAGLEMDDIIVGFQGEAVKDYDEFVAGVQKLPPQTEISLEIIHNGQRKNVKLTLAVLTDEPQEWKYPFRQEVEEKIPGRVFRLDPEQRDWLQILPEDLPESVTRLFSQMQTVRIQDEDNDIEIRIEGDPQSDDAQITVQDYKEKKTLQTTKGQIEQLPEKYREIVKKTLEDAVSSRHFELPGRGLGERFGRQWDQYFDRERLQQDLQERMREQEEFFKDLPRLVPERRAELESNLQRLEERLGQEMRQLQKHHEETLDKLLEHLNRLDERQSKLMKNMEELLKKIKNQPPHSI